MNTNRNLTTIAAEILDRTQSIADVIEIGALLIEAQDLIPHGEWLPWVEDALDFSERSAQNYMAAHRFSLKYATVADLKLTLGALYELASSTSYKDAEIKKVLAAAAYERVNRNLIDSIIVTWEPPEPPAWEPPEEPLDEEDEDDDESAAALLLDGPPPDLPPTEEAPAVDFAGPAFKEAVETLSRLSTKPLREFKAVAYLPEVTKASEFLKHIIVEYGDVNAH
jgi:hypothetical protein